MFSGRMTNSTDQQAIVSFLEQPSSYPDPTDSVSHIETHISHLFLTGSYAYKLKKAVRFDFLDFSTSALRRRFCEEEIRLNSRFSPELYLAVVPVSRGRAGLIIGPGGEVEDYLVKMRQFDSSTVFEELAAQNRLTRALLLEATDVIAKFHRTAEIQPGFWGPEQVAQVIRGNISVCEKFTPWPIDSERLKRFGRLSESALQAQVGLINNRQHTHVRALHGDLHLRNICIYDGKVHLFDGIEFNPEFANCDVWADLGFFIMDLMSHNRGADAAHVWNRYLLQTDDFAGLKLLDLYISYRAAVRAKVNCLEIKTAHSLEQREQFCEEANRYLSLGCAALESRQPRLIAIGGLSGSGKSTLALELSARLLGVHIRSDAVRKHLCGLDPFERAPLSAYSEEISEKTYDGMLERIKLTLDAGRTVIVDAVFKSPVRRSEIERLAEERGTPFAGVWCDVSPEAAAARISCRTSDVSDADLSVAEQQQAYNLGDIRWHRIDSSPLPPEAVLAAAIRLTE